MFGNKNYPHTITLRKGFLVIIGVIFALVMVYVVNLVDKSSKSNINNKNQNEAIHKYANDNDISTITNTANTNISNKSTDNLPSIAVKTVNTANNNLINNRNINGYDEKAMSAPISSIQYSNSLINNDTTSPSSEASVASTASPQNSSNNDDQNMQQEKKAFLQYSDEVNPDDYLNTTLQNPVSHYEVQAGSIIPCVLITGINSDLPGQITAQVRSNVYDSITGNYLLIPQGAKLIGLYDSQIAYGQERVLIAWNRIIYPNGKSIDLEGMPGIDLSGYAGFNDEVNNHDFKIFSSVLLMSALSAGAQLSQPQQGNSLFAAPTVGQTLAQSLGTNIANTGNMIAQKDINIQPTLTIRPGYEFNISVTKDMVFPSVYSG